MVGIKNKKGLSALILVFFVFLIFFLILYLGVQAYAVSQVQNVFSSIDFNIGNVSFNESYGQTLNPALQTIIDRSDNAGLVLIFGMIIVMFLIGYNFRANRLWIIFDFFAILVTFAISVYLSRFFNTFINSNSELLTLYSTTMQKSSAFVLNLPASVIIVGALMMVLTYGILRKRGNIVAASEFR